MVATAPAPISLTLRCAPRESRDSSPCQTESQMAAAQRSAATAKERRLAFRSRRSSESQLWRRSGATPSAYRGRGVGARSAAYDLVTTEQSRGRSPIGRGRALKPPPVRVRVPPSPLQTSVTTTLCRSPTQDCSGMDETEPFLQKARDRHHGAPGSAVAGRWQVGSSPRGGRNHGRAVARRAASGPSAAEPPDFAQIAVFRVARRALGEPRSFVTRAVTVTIRECGGTRARLRRGCSLVGVGRDLQQPLTCDMQKISVNFRKQSKRQTARESGTQSYGTH